MSESCPSCLLPAPIILPPNPPSSSPARSPMDLNNLTVEELEQLKGQATPVDVSKLRRVEVDKLTVHVIVYHQNPGEDPFQRTSIWDRRLKSGDQPYQRRLTIGQEWTPLDLGWIKEPGYILLENRAGRREPENPTEERKAEIASMVLDVGFFAYLDPGSGPAMVPSLVVRPGGAQPFELYEGARVYLRSAYGSIPVNVYVFPQ